MSKQDRIFYFGAICCTFILSVTALYTNGTGGDGDTLLHFLISKYSWKHPQLFLDHWGKPLFTFISSPFAQFGFKGIKLFNCGVAFLTCILTYFTAKHLQIKQAHWLWVLFFFIPFNITNTLSGLTEPLFALVLIASVFFYVKGEDVKATTIVSFLPFVRSEGLIILCVFLVYLIFKRKFRIVPLLLAGHLTLAISGMILYKDIFWVFNRIPYASMSSIYGSGEWDHFFVQLNFMIGPVPYALLIVGILSYVFLLFKKGTEGFTPERFFLVYGTFAGFFVAHTLFWMLGIFGSMGLTRVFVGVMPLMSLIMLDGLNSLSFGLIKNEKVCKVIFLVIVALIMIYPFLHHPSSLNLKQDFSLTDKEQLIQDRVVPYLRQKHANGHCYYSDIAFAYFLDEDIFNPPYSKMIAHKAPGFKLEEGEVIIWDDWFSPLEENIQQATLDSCLFMEGSFTTTSYKGKEINVRIYTAK